MIKPRTLPTSFGAEASLVAGLFRYPQLIPELATRAPLEDFEHDGLRALFDVARKDAAMGRDMDIVALADKAAKLADPGLVDQAAQAVMETSPTESSMFDHAARVADLADRRRINSAILSANAALFAEGANAAEIGSTLSATLQKILSGRSAEAVKLRDAVIADFEARLADVRAGVSHSVKTGVDWIDKRLRLRRTGVLLVGAREKVGKTWLIQQIAIALGEHGERVGWASTEMTTAEIGERVVGAYHGPQWLLDRDPANAGEAIHAIESAKLLPGHGVYFWTEHSATRLLAEASRLVASKKITVLVVDYLQDLQTPPDYGDTNTEAYPALARRLKEFAQAHKCLVIAVTSLRKPQEPNAEPHVSDMMGGAKLAYTADSVLLLSKPNFRYPNLFRCVIPIARGSADARVCYLSRGEDFRYSEMPWETGKTMAEEKA